MSDLYVFLGALPRHDQFKCMTLCGAILHRKKCLHSLSIGSTATERAPLVSPTTRLLRGNFLSLARSDAQLSLPFHYMVQSTPSLDFAYSRRSIIRAECLNALNAAQKINLTLI